MKARKRIHMCDMLHEDYRQYERNIEPFIISVITGLVALIALVEIIAFIYIFGGYGP